MFLQSLLQTAAQVRPYEGPGHKVRLEGFVTTKHHLAWIGSPGLGLVSKIRIKLPLCKWFPVT